jgi:hypothetical protein
MIGVGVARPVLLFLAVSLAPTRDSVWRMVGHADLMLRAVHHSRRPFAPHAEIGFSSHLVSLPGERELLGTGLTLGVGTELRLRDTRSVDVGVQWWRGTDSDLRANGRVQARNARNRAETLRVRIGYRWRPPVRRRPA